MRDDNEIKEMFVSSLVMMLAVFFPVLFLTTFSAAFKLSAFYTILFYVPFLPLAYSFKDLNAIQKGFISNILGLGYVGIYATFDVFLKIKLELMTYSAVTLIILCISAYFYIREK